MIYKIGGAQTPNLNLDQLSDVAAPSPGDGNVLTYDTDTNAWIASIPQSTPLGATPSVVAGAAETVNRVLGVAGNDTPATGVVCLTMFEAESNLTVGNVSMNTATANSSGLTLARMGLYTIDGSGNATLVARTASDTTLFNSSNTLYTRTFSTVGGYPATYNLVKGQRYALGVICVGSAGGNYLSTLILSANTSIGAMMAASPRLAGNLNGQADLPASIAAGSFVNRGRLHYGRFTA
jgi:hypothetical protein